MRFRAALLLALAIPLLAHVGSPEVFYEGSASSDVRRIRILPLRITAAQQFPPVPNLARPGRYALYGDIVHANDAPPISKADYNRSVTALSGGGRMVWERGSAPLHPRQPYLFRFRVEDSAGQPVRDMPAVDTQVEN